MLDQMPDREGASRTQLGREEPDWSEGEERFGGQRGDSSGDETPSADCLCQTWHHLHFLEMTQLSSGQGGSLQQLHFAFYISLGKNKPPM